MIFFFFNLLKSLKINNTSTTLEILTETEIIVTCESEKKIPSILTFKDIKFEYNKEEEIEIPIQANLSEILIEVKN